MPQKLSELVRNCHERAAAAKQRAEAAMDAAAKADFLDMERCWLSLADHYAFAESLSAQKLNERMRADAGIEASQAADLIERVQVETALRESEQHLRWLASIVESSNDPIVSVSIEHVITTWNGAAERLFDYSADEVIGRPIAILVPLDRRDEQPTIFQRITNAERIDNYETVRLRKDGSSVDVSLTISPVKDAEGKIAGSSAIYRDITVRKRAEKREKMLMAELNHRVKNVLARVDMAAMSSRNASSSMTSSSAP